MNLSYWEMVAVGWRILWQGIGGFVLTLFLGNLVVLGVLPELTRTDPSYWALAVPLLTALVLSLFVLLPLVVRGLIRGPFGTFRLVVKRDDRCRSTLLGYKEGDAMINRTTLPTFSTALLGVVLSAVMSQPPAFGGRGHRRTPASGVRHLAQAGFRHWARAAKNGFGTPHLFRRTQGLSL